MKYEIRKTTNVQLYWRIVADNGQVLATSEPYTSLAGCENAIDAVQKGAATAETVVVP